MKTDDHEDYRNILMNEFEVRKNRRPSYSMRAFARDLGLAANRLNAVINGKFGLSAAAAKTICQKLHFSQEQTFYFINLVESRHGRSRLGREQAKKKLQRISINKIFSAIDESKSALAGRWFYPAVLELISGQPKITSQEMAKRFGVTIAEVDEGLRVLLRIGLINKDGNKLKVANKFYMGSSATPKHVFRQFHSEVLDQVKTAIHTRPIEQRQNVSAVFSFDSSKIKTAKLWLEKMHKEFLQEFGESKSLDSIMAFGIHLVPICERENDA